MPIVVTPHILKLVKDEKKMLRAELQGLKRCQIQFLTGAVVSVGVIVGYHVENHPHGMAEIALEPDSGHGGREFSARRRKPPSSP
jgi:hypothetical protein